MQNDERQNHERIERLIDAGLRSYADPPSTPHAQVAVARVLERARELRSRPRWHFSWPVPLWTVAVPAIACAVLLLIAAIVWIGHVPPAPSIAWVPNAPGVAATPSSSQLPQRVRAARIGGLIAEHASAAPPQPLPKLDVFPTPTPLSPQEQALVAFAAQAPPAVKQQVIVAQQHIADPLTIAELKIRPLDQGEKQQSGKEKELP